MAGWHQNLTVEYGEQQPLKKRTYQLVAAAYHKSGRNRIPHYFAVACDEAASWRVYDDSSVKQPTGFASAINGKRQARSTLLRMLVWCAAHEREEREAAEIARSVLAVEEAAEKKEEEEEENQKKGRRKKAKNEHREVEQGQAEEEEKEERLLPSV